MEQRLVATRQILSENDNLLTLQYFLLKERSPSRKQKYSIKISKLHLVIFQYQMRS